MGKWGLVSGVSKLSVVLVELLGPLVVVRDDGALIAVPGAPKVRAVLETLALNAGAVVQTSQLVDALWGDQPPRSANKALQVYIAELRQSLPAGIIKTEAGGYSLTIPSDHIDANRFERLVVEGSSALEADETVRAVRRLVEALDMWRGEPLVELAGGIIGTAEIARLSELRRLANESLMDARLRMGEHAAIISDLEAAVSEEPLRERRWALLMLGLYRAGRQADALAAYQRVRRLLADELGLVPSGQLAELERAILMHDPSLDLVDSPGLRPKYEPRGRLPASISSFIGRERETLQLRELLGERRLVTITGVGGCGKTRLAVNVASAMSGDFPDGAWFVDLASTDDHEIAAAFAASLRLHHNSERPLIEVLSDYITGQHLLIVADNCEHIIDQAAKVIARLLIADEHLTVLATSREPLEIPGEAVWRLDPLPVAALGDTDDAILASESVRLFIARARDIVPGLGLDSQSVQTIGEIVALLDGLPLAIELAAALAGTMTLSEICGRLDASVSLLTRGPRTASPRQQTLAATLDWSFQLLSPTEQATLRRLSVFAGSFDLNAARPVASLSLHAVEDVSPQVWGLCTKSLVVAPNPAESSRFRLLEPTRQFAHEHLVASGEQPIVEAVFSDYYLDVASRAEVDLRGRNQASVFSHLRTDHENLRRALHLLAAHPDGIESALRMLTWLQRYWLFSGDQAEWLELAAPLTAADNAPVRLEVKARALAAQCFLASSFDPTHARQCGDEAIRLARRAGDDRSECEALTALAVNGLFSDRLDPSTAERALLVARQSGDPALIGQALAALSFTQVPDMNTAVQRNREAVEHLHGSGDYLFEVFSLNNLAVIYEQADDLTQAAVYTEQATDLASQIGYGFPIGLANLAELRIRQGRTEAAVEPLETGLRLARRRSLRDLLIILRVIVRLATIIGDYAGAAQLQGYFKAAWTSAGFEASILNDRFAQENEGFVQEAPEKLVQTYSREGASMNSQSAIELADQIIELSSRLSQRRADLD